MRIIATMLACGAFLLPAAAFPQTPHWVTAWAGAAQGPYPVGNPSAQPVLTFAFPSPEAGARDQSFRLIVRPDIFGPQARLRFSNLYGTQPVTLDHVGVGVQLSGSAILPGSLRAASFHGHPALTLQPGELAWSDALPLDPAAQTGRKLSVSFHVAGDSGPMTWHAKALTTSYLSAPGAGSAPAEHEDELGFPFSTTSWYFLDALDVAAPAETRALVAFGDSITDGTASTLNGDDRWPDVLSRRLHAAYGDRFSVVNEGIGGNQVVGPARYSAKTPFAGGASAQDRLESDIIGLSGVADVILLEGINDFGKQGNAGPQAVQAGMQALVTRLRAGIPGVRVLGATLVSALGSSNVAHGSEAEDDMRRAFNDFLRGTTMFDGVIDFDAATRDPKTGGLRPEFVPESTTGGPGDKLHPNRAGYQAMGASVPLTLLVP